MNINKLILLRTIETLFIAINLVTIKKVNIVNSLVHKFSFDFALINIDPNSTDISIDSAVIGYLLSMFGTLYFYRHNKTVLNKISLFLSGLGIMSFIWEMIRFFFIQSFQIVLQAGFVLIIIDWYCLLWQKRGASR